jgi:hypothetical protein
MLLLAGCSSTPERSQLSADALAKRDVEIRNKCDFIVGPPRDSQEYLSCLAYIETEMK